MPHLPLQYAPNFPISTSFPQFGHFPRTSLSPLPPDPFPEKISGFWGALFSATSFLTMSSIPAIKSSSESSPFATCTNAFSQSAVSIGDLSSAGRMLISFKPSSVGISCFFSRFTKPSCTSFSMMSALVAGVPIPFLSTSSSISDAPAFSMAVRIVASVYLAGAFVNFSATSVCCTGYSSPRANSGITTAPAMSSPVESDCFASLPPFIPKYLRSSSSFSFHPSAMISFPVNVKVCPSQESSTFLERNLCFSPVAQSSRSAIRYKIFFSLSGSSPVFLFDISTVGMIAWWSVTFLLLSSTGILEKCPIISVFPKANGRANTAFSTLSAVRAISSDRYWLSVLGYVTSFSS